MTNADLPGPARQPHKDDEDGPWLCNAARGCHNPSFVSYDHPDGSVMACEEHDPFAPQTASNGNGSVSAVDSLDPAEDGV